VDVRFNEHVWRARDGAVQSLPEEQSGHGLLGIAACEGLQLTQRRLAGEDLAESAAARLERRDDVVRVAKRFPQDRNPDRPRLPPNAASLS